MDNRFSKTAIAVGVALLLGSGAVVAADADTTGSGAGPGYSSSVANSLNTTGSGNTTVGNTFSTTEIDGSSILLDANTTIDGTASVTGNASISGSTTITGNTTMNGSTNSMGTGSSTNTITGVNTMTGTNTLSGTSTTINSTTNTINGTTTNINSSSSVGINTQAATINAQTAAITGSTSVNATGGGNSNLSLVNGQASLSSGTVNATSGRQNGYTAYAAPQTVNAATLINGDAQSKAMVNGAQVTNYVQGNTLFDGDVFINGKLTYSANNSATTSVMSGTSILAGASHTTNGKMYIGNNGEWGAKVDANGRITKGYINESTSALLMTNGYGETHGFVVNETQATMSGGVNSTSLTLNDNGARFSNTATGGPVRVTGVADGKHPYDAVNYRQLESVKAGVAGIAAMNNIPQVDQNKNFMLGVGVGHFDGSTALSVGGSVRVKQDAIVKASISTGVDGGTRNSTVFGVGAGFSW